MRNLKPSLFALPVTLVAGATATAQVTVDGTIAGDSYGAAKSVQTVETQFGDNLSELNAAYITIDSGRLYIALTGNLEDNFNKLEIFIDSKAGGENAFSGTPGNDNVGVMTSGCAAGVGLGLVHEAGFEPDYHVILRRGFDVVQKYDVDIAELGTTNFSSYIDVMGGVYEGSATTGTGPANALPIEIAYDNSNIAGVLGGIGNADTAAAEAVQTGTELSIALSDIGDPTGEIKFSFWVNGSNHDFASNQCLPPFQAPQGNPGGDSFGGFTGCLDLDFGSFPGDQCLVFQIGDDVGTNYCLATVNSTGSSSNISGSGSASIAANDLTLTADNLPQQPGIFIAGPTQAQIPFFNGFLCVNPTGLQRFTAVNIPDAQGRIVQAVDYPNSAQGGLNASAGQSYYYQRWNRDPAAGGGNANFSNGLEVAHTP